MIAWSGANSNHIRSIRALFVCFETVSGLKENMAKSVLIPVDNVGDLAGILGCKTNSIMLKYLGLPLGACYKAKSIWYDIVEKIERKLASWKRMYLFKSGRVTLITNSLSNLPTYFLSLFPIPIFVANRIKKLQQDFLWGGIGDEFKYHLVSWSKVCSPISEGGLGIRNLWNLRVLGKWLWHYANDREAWRRIVMEVGGALSTLQGHMVWGFGSILVRDGGYFLVISNLIQGMNPILDFGMMCGVEV